MRAAGDQAYNNYCKGFHMAVIRRLHAVCIPLIVASDIN